MNRPCIIKEVAFGTFDPLLLYNIATIVSFQFVTHFVPSLKLDDSGPEFFPASHPVVFQNVAASSRRRHLVNRTFTVCCMQFLKF